MKKERLEAYTDAITAIIITLMVLEIKAPVNKFSFESLLPIIHLFLIYVSSFAILTIYWINHYHLFHHIKNIHPKVLWSNTLNILVLTTFPFVTSWLGNDLQSEHLHHAPAILYAVILLLANLTYFLLTKSLIKNQENVNAEVLVQKKACQQAIIPTLLAIIIGVFSPLLTIIISVSVMFYYWIFKILKHRHPCKNKKAH